MSEEQSVQQAAPSLPPGRARRPDSWFGDRSEILSMWPGAEVGPDEHVHAAWCGGYYNHSHPEGQQRHVHEHDTSDGCLERHQACWPA